MKITKDDVLYVASLAHLNVSEEEQETLVRELEGIIGFADQLGELDTEGIEPTMHAVALENVFREDVPVENFDREELLKNAPSQTNGCFEVPKVVE